MKKLLLACMMALGIGASAQTGATCATAVPITTLPFSSGPQTTCGSGNDYTGFTTNYGGGEDFVYSIDITTAPVTLNVSLGGSASWKVASVQSACPPTTATEIGRVTTGGGSTGTSNITFPTVGTYYIIVDTWPSPTCGSFTLDITAPPPAADCPTLTAPANGSTVANLTPTLSWTAATTGPAPTGYKVYLGTTNPPTTAVSTITNPSTNTYTANLTAYNTQYYWYVAPVNGATETTGCTVFSFTSPAPPPPPANDDVAGATMLTVNPDYSCGAVTAGTTIGATASTPAPSCTPAGANDDVWYSFVATGSSHRVSIANVSGSDDMNMVVYEADGTTVVTGGGACANVSTKNLTGLVSGNTYIVRIYTWSTTATTRSTFNVCVGSPPPPPANDECATPTVLTPGASFAQNQVTGVTYSATTTTDTTATRTCQTQGFSDTWYSVVVPASGSITIETKDGATGDLSDTILGVYTGTCGALTEVGCNDDDGDGLFSKVSLTGQTPGTTLLVGVWNYSSSTSGEFLVSAYDASLATTEIIAENKDVKVYPNPFTDVLHISDIKDVVSVTVTDMSGRMVKTIAKPTAQLQLGDLKSGLYLVTLKYKDGSVKTVKAIKK